MRNLIGWQQFGTALVQSQFVGNIFSHFSAVTRQHYRFLYSKFFQLSDGMGASSLKGVVDHNMSRILAINGDVDDGSHLVAVVPLGTDAFHHLLVAHANHLSVHFGTDTLSCNLLYIGHLAAIRCFLREGSPQGCSDRMSGEMLGMSCQMKQDFLLVRIFANMHIICIVG